MRNGVVPQVIRPAQAGSAGNGEHPYLRSVQHRGGGYAILRALWDAEKSPSYEGHLDEIYVTWFWGHLMGPRTHFTSKLKMWFLPFTYFILLPIGQTIQLLTGLWLWCCWCCQLLSATGSKVFSPKIRSAGMVRSIVTCPWETTISRDGTTDMAGNPTRHWCRIASSKGTKLGRVGAPISAAQKIASVWPRLDGSMQSSNVVVFARLMYHVCCDTGHKDIRCDKISSKCKS